MHDMQRQSGNSAKQVSNLSGLQVTVCCEPDSHFDGWIRELQRARVEINRIWPPPSRLSPSMDILICDYFPEIGDLMPWIPGDAKGALVVVLPQNGRYDENVVISAAPQCVLQRPFPSALLSMTVKVAWSQFRYELRLRKRISRLDENLRSIRDVERAKLIIMSEKNLDEEAAYRYLRELAMQRQQSLSTLASAIIQSPNPIR